LIPATPAPLSVTGAAVKPVPVSVAAKLRRWMGHAMEPHILFPMIAALVLAVIWGATLSLIKVERTTAERAAVASSHELADTYEAQVVRSLREIDQTLKFVSMRMKSGTKRPYCRN
jgi:hypothetical protein